MFIITSQRKIISFLKNLSYRTRYLTPVDCFLSLLSDYLLFENTCYVDKVDLRRKQPMIFLITNACKFP